MHVRVRIQVPLNAYNTSGVNSNMICAAAQHIPRLLSAKVSRHTLVNGSTIKAMCSCIACTKASTADVART